jgi:hypothetical protein
MELFNAKSSRVAMTFASKVAKAMLNGRKKDFMQVRGTLKSGSKCEVLNGAGVPMNLWCSLSYTFACEYEGKR